jgi:hypothetical protein
VDEAKRLKREYDRLFTCRLEDQKSKREMLRQEKLRSQQLVPEEPELNVTLELPPVD